MKLTATKSFRYSTRRLLAGDDFEARPTDAKVLVAIGKARKADERPAEAQPEPVDERVALRDEYQTRSGRKAFPGWSADQLRDRLAALTDD